MSLLEVEELRVSFHRPGGGWLPVVDGLSLAIEPGETLCLLGESGCGKSVAAAALLRLFAPGEARIEAKGLRYAGRDLLALEGEELRRLRGGEIAMIFQEPRAALNPVFTVGAQVAEAIRAHRPLTAAEARAEAVRLLAQVGIPEPARRFHEYPHQFSGGMAQRAMLAIALAGRPRLLIADEPTTALDVTVQAQILALLRRLSVEEGLAILLITHDLGVVAEMADRVLVMYAGQGVEEGTAADLFTAPRHPYTAALLQAARDLTGPAAEEAAAARMAPALEGRVPEPGAWPPGCRFAPRCPHVEGPCQAAPPPWEGGNRCRRSRELSLPGLEGVGR